MPATERLCQRLGRRRPIELRAGEEMPASDALEVIEHRCHAESPIGAGEEQIDEGRILILEQGENLGGEHPPSRASVQKRNDADDGAPVAEQQDHDSRLIVETG